MQKITVAAPAIDKGAISVLFDNLDLIITNKHEILSTEKYHNIKISGMFVCGLYVGSHELLLGDILNLWENTEWKTDNKYYFNIIGTPLSGMNTAYWYNKNTKQIESGTYFNGKLHFLGLAGPALEYKKKNPCIQPISKLSIFNLIQKLKTK